MEAFLVDGLRTPIGRFGGSLLPLRATEFGSTVAATRVGLRNAHGQFTDTLKECTLAGSGMWGDSWSMVDVAEHHAKVDGLTREEMDHYAVISHRRALDAIDGGRLEGEILPIEVPDRKVGTRIFSVDEHPRRDVSLETLARLEPVREGGTVTAGNAAGINDGAAAALICSERAVGRLGLEPLARIVLPGTALVGCDPRLMGYSCVD